MSDCCHCNAEPVPPLAEAWGKYTCPMHPEVIRDGPGDCPICGMPLEGVGPAPEDRREEQDLTRRLMVGLLLTLPVFVLAMAHFWPLSALARFSMTPSTLWAQALLATPVFFWAGFPFHRRAWQSVLARRANMFTLISLGTGAAWFFSAWQLLSVAHHPALYFEAAAMIIVLALIGQGLEARGRRRAGEAVRGLLDLTPATARRVLGDRDEEVSVAELLPGDLVRIRPGERFPVDGEVTDGRSDVDEATMTGEAAAVLKEPGSAVLAGTINGRGTLLVKTSRTGRETLLGQIIHLVSAAQRSRMPVQNLADDIAEWFVPAVLIIAVLTAVVWAFVDPALALPNAVAVLIIDCPCAIGLATPMSVTVAVGRAAQLGILVRDAAALQAISRIDIVALDKTGTLTEGRPEVAEVRTAGSFEAGEVLRLAAAVERASEHPLAGAFLRAAGERALPNVTDFSYEPGGGVRGTVEGRAIVVGSAPFLRSFGMEAPEEGVSVGVDGTYAATVTFSDPVRQNARATLRELEALGVQPVMLTGDSEAPARRVAEALGLARWHASLRPTNKAEAIRTLQKAGRRVLMAGDGVNDAPALAVSDCAVAMGVGADVAKESAGLILLKNRIELLVPAIRLGRATVANIRQNLFFAFVYNVLGIPIAAGILYPLTGWLLSPLVAGAAMSLSSVTVISNALRLKRF